MPLPPSLLQQLRTHYQNQKPQTYLFEGPVPGNTYSATSMSSILKRAVSQSDVAKGKKVTLYTLRHSYATHLMEKGTELRIIQVRLSHSSSKTTEISTHVSNHTPGAIQSPFDNL
ncbi:MAG: tyrosine-type recombinase/integrase [Flavobacteriales bacterium]